VNDTVVESTIVSEEDDAAASFENESLPKNSEIIAKSSSILPEMPEMKSIQESDKLNNCNIVVSHSISNNKELMKLNSLLDSETSAII